MTWAVKKQTREVKKREIARRQWSVTRKGNYDVKNTFNKKWQSKNFYVKIGKIQYYFTHVIHTKISLNFTNFFTIRQQRMILAN